MQYSNLIPSLGNGMFTCMDINATTSCNYIARMSSYEDDALSYCKISSAEIFSKYLHRPFSIIPYDADVDSHIKCYVCFQLVCPLTKKWIKI